MQEAIGWLTIGKLDLERLLTHHYPFDQLASALEIACWREEGFLKAIVWIS